MAEYEWTMSLGTDVCLVHGTRYMDDVMIFVVYVLGDENYPRWKAEKILRSHQVAYDEHLTLEATKQEEEDEWEYMETTVSVAPMYPWLKVAHRMKQQDLLLSGSPPTMSLIVPYDTYAPESQKLGVLIGTLRRMGQNCMYPVDVLFAIVMRRPELLRAGWPDEVLFRATSRVADKLGGSWGDISVALQSLTGWRFGP